MACAHSPRDTRMLLATVFVISASKKPPTCLAILEWINKNIHKIEYPIAMRMNEL